MPHKKRIQAIGDRLRQARTVARLSQNDVAELMDVSRQTVSNWEGGRMLPSLLDFSRLVAVYGVTADFLIFGLVTIPVDMLDQIRPGECEYLDRARKTYKATLAALTRKGHDSGFKPLD